jgi:hypothetical protein
MFASLQSPVSKLQSALLADNLEVKKFESPDIRRIVFFPQVQQINVSSLLFV